MNIIEKLMGMVLVASIIMSGYLTYHSIVRLDYWREYAVLQGCSFVGRAQLDHKIIIECNGVPHIEDTRTYGGLV